eukprot:COSAG04_NODE_23997_length_328_cov_1.589520_1_plen_76_part_10
MRATESQGTWGTDAATRESLDWLRQQVLGLPQQESPRQEEVLPAQEELPPKPAEPQPAPPQPEVTRRSAIAMYDYE